MIAFLEHGCGFMPPVTIGDNVHPGQSMVRDRAARLRERERRMGQ
jgi:hypothetical protein